QDTASKADGGKFTAFEGRTVGPFDDFIFSAKPGELSDPIKTEFGWHIVEVLSAVKPPTTMPLDQVKDSIKTTGLQTKYADDIAYAPGYAPASTTDTTAGTTTVG